MNYFWLMGTSAHNTCACCTFTSVPVFVRERFEKSPCCLKLMLGICLLGLVRWKKKREKWDKLQAIHDAACFRHILEVPLPPLCARLHAAIWTGISFLPCLQGKGSGSPASVTQGTYGNPSAVKRIQRFQNQFLLTCFFGTEDLGSFEALSQGHQS